MKLLYERNSDIRLRHPRTVDFPPHLHEALEIVFVEGGTFTAICGTQRYSLSAGEVFIAFPNQVHGYENNKDFQGYVFIIPSKPYLSAYRKILEQKLPVTPVLRPELQVYTELVTLLQLAFSDRKEASTAMMQGYANVVTGKLLSLMTLTEIAAGTDALQAVLYYISEHYNEPISRKELALAVGYNESYISHLFADVLNTTLTNYITTLRLRDAKHLLTTTELPVSRIAMSMGFASIRCFNRIFAREVGTTPTAYRKQRRK